MKAFLQYNEGNSLLHRLNPLTKLIMAVCLCAVCFFTDNLAVLTVILIFNLLLGFAAGIFKTTLHILKGFVKLSVVLFLLQIFFIRDGAVILRFPFNIYITDRGLYISSLIVMRLICAAMPLTIMLAVTKTNDLLNVMVKKLFIPYKYAFSLMTAVKFIPLFSAEMAGIIEAQTVRGVEFDTNNIFKKIKLILPLCVPLLLTSVRKTEGSAIAAELRGFEYRTRLSGYYSYKLKPEDYTVIVLSAAVVICFLTLKFI